MADVMDRLQRAVGDRYAIEREVGRGGMATVYLARDLKHERHVAIKVFHPELAQVLGSERFLREVKVTAQLHHPHILPLYDSGNADGLLYYVMPYVEGESLRDRLERERQLPLEDALQISREVAEALAYAHSHDVIHRDIKPENILLESGHAVVADFGIARAITVAGGQRLTATGMALGTPAYMSPEQGAGEQALDGRSDLYSLGCVLYEMLAGEPPITGPSVAAVLARKSVDVPVELRRVRSAVPASVEQTVTRALSVLPADRQRTALEFAEQLSSVAVIHTEPAPGPDAAGAPIARRRRLAPWRLAVVGLAVLGAAVVLWRVMSRGASDATVAANRVVVVPFDNRTGDSALNPIGGMVADWITEGLARTAEVQVVPSMIVVQTLGELRSGSGGGTSEVPIQDLARATQSSVAVTGSYYRHGDSLEFHSEVLDVTSGGQLGALEPVLGPAKHPTAAIDTVRAHVMAMLAARLGGIRWEIPTSVQPPNYDAYRAYADGMSRWIAGDYLEAAVLWERAYVLDSTYLRAVIMAANAYGNAAKQAKSDSLLAFIQRRRNQLSPYDQYRIDWLLAGRRGDREAQLRAARAGVELAPYGTIRSSLVLSLEAVNRPREALAELEDIVAQGAGGMANAWYRVWGVRTELYHVLGEHEKELRIAQAGRAQLGSTPRMLEYEGRALAALGRMEDLRAVTEEALVKGPGQGVMAGDVLLSIAEELRAHGHGVEGAELTDRALAWYRAQPQAMNRPGWRWDLLVSLLYLRERWADAAAQWDSLPADSTNVVQRLGLSGTLAAHLGLADSARTIDRALARLDLPDLRGQHTLWRARIAAVLGDKDSAVTLLRQAFAQGLGYGIWLHVDTDLEALRDYKPFKELVRPKG
jgi:tRNA A-37 threonylcarbamoyl transferase component Bud32/TolB-like protein